MSRIVIVKLNEEELPTDVYYNLSDVVGVIRADEFNYVYLPWDLKRPDDEESRNPVVDKYLWSLPEVYYNSKILIKVKV